MQLVIDITEHEWEYLNKLVKNGDVLGHYERLLVNGVPLPKKHGRLIDADSACEGNCAECPVNDICIVNKAPTVIEAYEGVE